LWNVDVNLRIYEAQLGYYQRQAMYSDKSLALLGEILKKLKEESTNA